MRLGGVVDEIFTQGTSAATRVSLRLFEKIPNGRSVKRIFDLQNTLKMT